MRTVRRVEPRHQGVVDRTRRILRAQREDLRVRNDIPVHVNYEQIQWMRGIRRVPIVTGTRPSPDQLHAPSSKAPQVC